jgi:hypothetical protein
MRAQDDEGEMRKTNVFDIKEKKRKNETVNEREGNIWTDIIDVTK